MIRSRAESTKYFQQRTGEPVLINSVTEEYAILNATTPFQWSGEVAYDSILESGDILQAIDLYFIVYEIFPELFQNKVFRKKISLLKSNAAVTISDLKEVLNTQTYQTTPQWVPVVTGIKGFLSNLAGVTLQDFQMGGVIIKQNELYIPHSEGIKNGFRVSVEDSGDNFIITGIRKLQHENIDVMTLEEDER